jgi:carboxylesterase type B
MGERKREGERGGERGGERERYLFLGIRYAKAPTGPLRFKVSKKEGEKEGRERGVRER